MKRDVGPIAIFREARDVATFAVCSLPEPKATSLTGGGRGERIVFLPVHIVRRSEEIPLSSADTFRHQNPRAVVQLHDAVFLRLLRRCEFCRTPCRTAVCRIGGERPGIACPAGCTGFFREILHWENNRVGWHEDGLTVCGIHGLPLDNAMSWTLENAVYCAFILQSFIDLDLGQRV